MFLLAEILNNFLQQHNRSASWLSQQLQISPSTVNRWLNGETRPKSAALVMEIANVLKIDDLETRQKLLEASGYKPQDINSNKNSVQTVLPEREEINEELTKNIEMLSLRLTLLENKQSIQKLETDQKRTSQLLLLLIGIITGSVIEGIIQNLLQR